jgi:ABC-type polar amino acid transport system ATPase subunit
MMSIKLQGVRKRFGSLEILRDFSLEVPAGATVAVLGPSGSGKSTMVRCVNHLEPIQGGQITVGDTVIAADGLRRNGKRLSHREVARFRTTIGMVFQSFNLFPHFTVLQNVIESPIGVLKWGREQAVKRAMELLRKVNLEDKAGAYPAMLSGGQQQRVAIVRSLVMDPPVMLFDEPTSALDPELIGEVLKVIKDLALKGRTSVIVTHELGFAREVADKVVFIDQGRVVEEGPPRDLLDNPTEERTRTFIGQIL